MIRRAFRVVVGGFCLLSLLACLGTGWLWWRSRSVFRHSAAASAGGAFAWGLADRDGLSAWVVGPGWPGPAGAWAEAAAEPADAMGWELSPYRVDWAWAGAGAAVVAGGYAVGVGEDGRAVRSGPRSGGFIAAAAGPMPARVVVDVPYWAALAATAVPPLLWLAVPTRRAWVRRRRRRMGLCLACGYDLRASPSGRCSECGAETPVPPAKGAAA